MYIRWKINIFHSLISIQLFIQIMSNLVLIHCNPKLEDFLIKNNFDYTISDDQDNTELDVFVPDVDYKDGNHPDQNGIWEDPDVQLCITTVMITI